ncbi:MAG TPA: hypothetical protein VMZ91_06890 [Candidatus Paceibacterota bacterium]|nr:hypothetical protein [Candidatus Paceibacterota bacterium]
MYKFTRAEQSSFLDKVFTKKAFNFTLQRAFIESIKKEDPFENIDFENVWLIKGNKLLKKRKIK